MITAMKSSSVCLLLMALILTPAACTDDPPDPVKSRADGTGGAARLLSIQITPAASRLSVTLAGGQTLQLQATGSYEDGSQAKLGSAAWSVERTALGKVDAGGLFSANGHGGQTRVTVTADGVTGSTQLTLVLADQVLGSGVTATDATRMAGSSTTDTTKAPAFSYPEDGTRFPFNLPAMTLQWNQGHSGNQLYALRLAGDHLDLQVVLLDKRQWQATAAVWSAVTNSAKGGTLKLTLSGTGRSAGPLYQGTSRTLQVADVPISGTIFYWATGPYGSAKNGIRQIEAGTATPKDYYTMVTGGTKRCAGCHALSRDGKKIVFTEYNDPKNDWTNYIKGLDVASKQTFVPADKLVGDFFTFSPKGDRMVSGEAGVLTLRSTTDGAALATLQAGSPASHPDWSPLEDRLALVLFPQKYKDDYHFCEGSIAVSALGSGGALSPKVIVASSGASDSNYYPTFSPDGKYLAFNRAGAHNNSKLGDSSCDLYANPGATLHLVSAAGGTPVALARANSSGKLTNSWPKWGPAGASSSETIWWLAFSSTRDYGHLLVNSTKKDVKGAKHPQIWITAIDVSKLASAQDPSHAAFWLPGQQTGSGNHIPFWTKSIK